MKKIIVDYKKGMFFDTLVNNNVYGVILNSEEYSLNPLDGLKLDELLNLNKELKKYNLKSFINIDRLIKEEEIDEFVSYFKKICDLFDYYIYSDMSVLTLVNDYSKLIYYPKTYISSTNELKAYSKLNIKSFLSNELSFEEIEDIDKANIPYLLEVFGFHQMFYSKRHLLSLYKECFNIEANVKNKELFIKEELRDEFYPIFETDKGTLIYTDYCYYLFSELDKLNNVDMVYINSAFIDLNTYLYVISLYNELISDGEIEELEKKLLSIGYKLDKGFLLKKSVLLKNSGGESDE